MVWGNNEDLLEVFIIDTENFKLWATLTSVKGGKTWVRGWVQFQNSKKIRFYREDMDTGALRKRLLIACGPIAAFYGGELIHRKIQTSGNANRDRCVMDSESRLIH